MACMQLWFFLKCTQINLAPLYSCSYNHCISGIFSIYSYRDTSRKAHESRDKEGFTPLLVAAKNGDEDIFRYLLKHIMVWNNTLGSIHSYDR